MSMMTYRHRKERRAKRIALHNLSTPKKSSTPKVENNEVKEEPVAEETVEPQTDAKYTKSDINRASTATLKEIAFEEGIEDADEKTGGELKKLIIEKLGL